MLVVKTGMASEFSVAKKYAAQDVLVLTGIRNVQQLRASVPSSATGIISFGLCGGLSSSIKVGDLVIASDLVTADAEYHADTNWNRRLQQCTHASIVRWWSTPTFNTANSKADRDALFHKNKCYVIDDETFAVAQFSVERKIAFTALRAVSDGEEDNLPPAVAKAVNDDGTSNLRAVIESVVADPFQIPSLIETAINYKHSLDSLKRAAIRVGANFQWGD